MTIAFPEPEPVTTPPSVGLAAGDTHDDLIEFARDAVIRVSSDGIIVAWSRRAETLYGWASADAVGLVLDTLLSPPSLEPHSTAYVKLASTGRWTGQLERRTAAGVPVLVDVEWTLTQSRDGHVDGFVEFGRSHGSRDEIDALRASEERYRQLFRSAPVALMLDDPASLAVLIAELSAARPDDINAFLDADPTFLERAVDSLCLAEVNDEALHLFGAVEQGQLLGPVRHIWADAPHTFRNALVAHYNGEPTFSEETRVRTLDGRTVDVLFSLTFPGEDDLTQHSLNGMRDISARREAEARLRKVSADYAHAARLSTLGELTTSIGHEVKQPLTAALVYAQTALRWLGKEVPDVDKARSLTLRIVEQTQRASDIIERIQYLAGKREPRRCLVDLNDAVRECLVFIRHESDDKRVVLNVDLDPASPRIIGDRIQLQQVVVNLIINSIQAMKVTAPGQREIRLATTASPEVVSLTVEDTGPGIATADLETVFDSFVTTKIGGMGIGLAVCRSIITAHGGSITASHAAGGGACFRVTLPLSAAGDEPVST